MMAKSFQKRPEKVEAIRYDGKNLEEIRNWTPSFSPKSVANVVCEFPPGRDGGNLLLDGAVGLQRVHPGDWIVCNRNGEFFRMIGAEFKSVYEEA